MKILLVFFYLVHHVVVRLRCESRGQSIFRDWKGGVLRGSVMDTVLRDEGDLVVFSDSLSSFQKR